MLDRYLARWGLEPDGSEIVTRAARLLPVRWRSEPAMLRVATHPEAKDGAVLMSWWEGDGAARVYAAEGDALLLERATGHRSLADYARHGRDDEATQILCDVIARLHAPRGKALPDLMPLKDWFAALPDAAANHGGLLARCAEIAEALLADQCETGVLHGDVHHGNVLDFGRRGWLAIDPNRLVGDRVFDYANLFCNPDLDDPSMRVAVRPDVFARRVHLVCQHANINRYRLLRWIAAWAGLSAAWFLSDGEAADIDFKIAELALAELV